MTLPSFGIPKTVTAQVGNTLTDILTAPAGKTIVIVGLTVTNTDVSGIQVDIKLEDVSEVVEGFFGKNLPIPAQDTLSPTGESKIILEAGDVLKIETKTASKTCDVIVSYIEHEITGFKMVHLPVVGTVEQDLYVVPVGKTITILGLNSANTDGNSVTISSRLEDDSLGITVHVFKDIVVSTGASHTALGFEKIILQENDRLKVACSTTGKTVDCTLSFIEE